jgi:hypothetical protein
MALQRVSGMLVSKYETSGTRTIHNFHRYKLFAIDVVATPIYYPILRGRSHSPAPSEV